MSSFVSALSDTPVSALNFFFFPHIPIVTGIIVTANKERTPIPLSSPPTLMAVLIIGTKRVFPMPLLALTIPLTADRFFSGSFDDMVPIIAPKETAPNPPGKRIPKTTVKRNIVLHTGVRAAPKITQTIPVSNAKRLPQSLKDALIENNNNQIYEALGVQQFNQYVASYMACLVLNAVSFLIIFLVALIILKIIEASLDLISKLPVLHGINVLGGLVCGVIHGLIILWILCIVVTVFAWTGYGQWILAQINANLLLSFLYNHNYLLSVLTNMGKMLF